MAFQRIGLSTLFLAASFFGSVGALGGCSAAGTDGKWEPSAAPAASEPVSAEESELTAGYKYANLTNFESYPDPGSEECQEYNGCTWAGQFAFVDGVKSKNWVKAHNIVAVHERDASKYRLKTLRLKKGSDTIDVKVYDECADSDCDGCCTHNANAHGLHFLIDIEKYTMQRFGHGDGKVEFKCLDCN
jgi:hypothetical protein